MKSKSSSHPPWRRKLLLVEMKRENDVHASVVDGSVVDGRFNRVGGFARAASGSCGSFPPRDPQRVAAVTRFVGPQRKQRQAGATDKDLQRCTVWEYVVSAGCLV